MENKPKLPEDHGYLFAITCPNCGQNWLIPRLEKYVCGKCQTTITIDYAVNFDTIKENE